MIEKVERPSQTIEVPHALFYGFLILLGTSLFLLSGCASKPVRVSWDGSAQTFCAKEGASDESFHLEATQACGGDVGRPIKGWMKSEITSYSQDYGIVRPRYTNYECRVYECPPQNGQGSIGAGSSTSSR